MLPSKSRTLLLASILMFSLFASPGLATTGLASPLPESSPSPFGFIPNLGQWGRPVAFTAESANVRMLFYTDRVRFAPRVTYTPGPSQPDTPSFSLAFSGTQPGIVPVGLQLQPGKIHYFLGRDPASWRPDVPVYARIRYPDLYPGIDLEFSRSDQGLERTYILDPGADPQAIRWAYPGAQEAWIDPASGSLIIVLHDPGEADPSAFRQIDGAPHAWQEKQGQRSPVPIRFRTVGDETFGFDLGAFDPALPLVIDPTLVFGTTFAGRGADYANDIALDTQGNIYLAGTTSSTDFPTRQPLYEGHLSGLFAWDPLATRWEQAERGLASEQITTLAVDPQNPSILYAGTADLGIFKTTDGGAHWAEANDGLPQVAGSPLEISKLVIYPRDPQIVFAAVSAHGLYKSSDGGQTWTITGGETDSFEARMDTLAIDPFDPQTLYGGDWDGLRKSTDGGDTWVLLDPQIDYVKAVAIHPQDSSHLYVNVIGGMFQSLDAGLTWQEVNTLPFQIFPNQALTIDPNQPDTLYVGSDYEMAKSTDGGKTWTITRPESVEVTAICVDPADSNHVIIGTVNKGIYQSTDGGGTWTTTNDGLTAASVNFVVASGGETSRVYAAASASDSTDAFLLKLDPSGKELLYATYLGGLSDDEAAALAVDEQGNAYLTGETKSADFPLKDPFQDTLHGQADVFVTKVSPDGSRLVYSTFLGGSAGDATNNFESAQDIAVNSQGRATLTGGTDSKDFPLKNPVYSRKAGVQNPFITQFDPAGAELIFSTYLGGHNGIWWGAAGSAIAVNDQGDIFVLGSTTSPDFPLVDPLFNSFNGVTEAFLVKIDGASQKLAFSTYLGGNGDEYGTSLQLDVSGILYGAGGTNSVDFPLQSPLQFEPDGGVSISRDGGQTWRASNAGLDWRDVSALVVDSGAPGSLVAGTVLGGVYRSTDGGQTWQNTGLDGNTVEALAVDPQASSTLYAGTSSKGVWRSADGGVTWSALGLDDDSVESLAVSPQNPDLVYAGTQSEGLYRFNPDQKAWDHLVIDGLTYGVESIAVDPQSPATLYAIANTLYKSTDGGVTWAGLEKELEDVNLKALILDPAVPERLFLGTDEGVLASRDGGLSWDPTGLTEISVSALAILPAVPPGAPTLFAGTSAGVYSSPDGGETWTQAVRGLAGQAVISLALDPVQHSTVYAGSTKTNDAFLFAFDTHTNQLLFASVFGGGGEDSTAGLSLDSEGAVYLLGTTESLEFPLVDPWQVTLPAKPAAFLAKLAPDRSRVVYATYLGGQGPVSPAGVVVNADGTAILTGSSSSTDFLFNPQIPVKEGTDEDAFLAMVIQATPTPTMQPNPTVQASPTTSAERGITPTSPGPVVQSTAAQQGAASGPGCLGSSAALVMAVGIFALIRTRRVS